MTTHTVRPGETLTSIARRYRCSASDLQSLNHLSNPDHIRAGQSLSIPPMRIPANTPHPPAPQHQASRPAQPIHPASASGPHDIWDDLGDVVTRAVRLGEGLLDHVANALRETEAKESVQQRGAIPLTPVPHPARHNPAPARASAGHKKASQVDKKREEVIAKFKDYFGKEPHVVTVRGTKLTQNERKQIMAAVAICEVNHDGFGSSNPDQEFVGRKFGKRGIKTGYSRIVHIGLSYGMIQFTQDSGNLGKLLARMNEKDPATFAKLFKNADLLLQLTSSGHPDYPNLPLSGQEYWKHIKDTSDGQERYRLANQDLDHNHASDLPVSREIRGRRVQPIPYQLGDPPKDIWEKPWLPQFIAAGDVPAFQEAQIELAVEDFFNHILGHAKRNNVRSAWGLAFIAACAVRGVSRSLFISVAKVLGLAVPFQNGRDELTCLQAIAGAKLVPGPKNQELGVVEGVNGKVSFDKDERRRARTLLQDELHFLTEDLYDTSTY